MRQRCLLVTVGARDASPAWCAGKLASFASKSFKRRLTGMTPCSRCFPTKQKPSASGRRGGKHSIPTQCLWGISRSPVLTHRPLRAGSPGVPAQRWEAATYMLYMLPECLNFQIDTLPQRHAEKSSETVLPGFKRKKLCCLTHRGEILENSMLGVAGRLSPLAYLHFTFQAFESRVPFLPLQPLSQVLQ